MSSFDRFVSSLTTRADFQALTKAASEAVRIASEQLDALTAARDDAMQFERAIAEAKGASQQPGSVEFRELEDSARELLSEVNAQLGAARQALRRAKRLAEVLADLTRRVAA